MQSARVASRRLAGAASRTTLRPFAQRLALRRTYASSSEGHGKSKSNEATWALGAIAITIPGLYFALRPSADAGHHDNHDDHHDSHGSGEDSAEQESGDDAEKDEQASEESADKKDGKEDDESKDEASDGEKGEKPEKEQDNNNDSKDAAKDSEKEKDPRKSKNTNDNPTSDAAHPRMHEAQLSNKKESGLPATVKEKRGHDGRL